MTSPIRTTFNRLLHPAIQSFRKAAASPRTSFFLPFLMVLIGRALLLGVIPPPEPIIQDEFAYLLGAETFASGRVTNPQHPLWEHFETIHQLVTPTYMMKYPPAQAVALAFGQVVFGMPWIGVMLSMAIFCGLLPWVFRAWVPCTWALGGALLATYKIGIISYWTDSFWGGGVAAIGGALVLGSVRRLSLESTPAMAALFALGVGILANSRPFEGAVFVIGCGVYLLWRWNARGRWRKTWPAYPLRFLPAACAVMVPVILAMGYYNYRVTGDVMELPYQEYQKQYAVWSLPNFWQKKPLHEPVYRHEYIRRSWIDFDSKVRTDISSFRPWLYACIQSTLGIGLFYFGPMILIGIFFVFPSLWMGTKNRSVICMAVFNYLCVLLEGFINPHYTAPTAALTYLAATQWLRACWLFRRVGLPDIRIFCALTVAAFVVTTTEVLPTYTNRFFAPRPWLYEKRHLVLDVLNRSPGLQMVIVNHGPHNEINDNWIYNSADIDASRIIWVDDMGPKKNQEVLDYYAKQHRTVWMLDDDIDLTLKRYGDPAAVPVVKVNNHDLKIKSLVVVN